MKRFTAVILMGAMSVTVLSGCSKSGNSEKTQEAAANVEVKKEGYPVVSEPIQINAVGFGEPGGGEWNEYPVFQEISEQTNVTVDWVTLAGDGSEEKLNLILASKDLPDAIFSGLSSEKIISYASKGLIRPLEDLIDGGYAPNIKRILDEFPQVRKSITYPDGSIYAIPAVNEDQDPVQSTTLNINKGWLDKLGLSIPKTTEEFEAVLKAFKTMDPNGNGEQDEIPFTYEPKPPYNIWNGDAGFSGAFGVTDSSSYVMKQGDEFVFTPIQEGYKEYVKWTSSLYQQGLIDVELFTQDHNQYVAKINSNRCGAYLTNGPIRTENAEYIAIEPLIGPNGDQLWSSLDFSIDKNRGLITTANQYPQATMRYIDSFYEPENSLKLRYGIWLEKRGDQYEIIPSVPGKNAMAPGPYVASCVTKDFSNQYIIKNEENEKSEARKQMYAPFLADPVPLINFTPEESKEISTLTVDIRKVVDESKAKWTTNQGNIDSEWDGYVASLNKMGLERYMELFNEALIRYKNN